jgi:CubicO group peptidase (beta-lactamase class C family)
LAITPHVARSGAPNAELAPTTLAQLRAGPLQAVAENRIAGAIHLVGQNGQILLLETIGCADLKSQAPMTAESVLRIYSMSKPITSVAAMILYEQGKFELDDPVCRFLPAFSNATVLATGDGPSRQAQPRRPITVRDVLRHTTGYSYGDESAVREFYEREGLRYGGPSELFPPKMTIAKAAESLARIPALHHPGERFTYGFNTDLLGRLIEIWSGEPLDHFLRHALFEPLEMQDTGFVVPFRARERFTTCYLLRENVLAAEDPSTSSPFHDGFEFLSGGGGLVSTVRDYANFCQMLVDGGQFKERRLLKEPTLKLMFTNQIQGADSNSRFGLGFAIDEVEMGSGRQRRLVTRFRWGGYASTEFEIVPQLRFYQIFALQQVPYSDQMAKQQFAIVRSGLNFSSLLDKGTTDVTSEHRFPPEGR